MRLETTFYNKKTQEIVFHTMILMNSTYFFKIWDKCYAPDAPKFFQLCLHFSPDQIKQYIVFLYCIVCISTMELHILHYNPIIQLLPLYSG
jgi:hypothetical protein